VGGVEEEKKQNFAQTGPGNLNDAVIYKKSDIP